MLITRIKLIINDHKDVHKNTVLNFIRTKLSVLSGTAGMSNKSLLE